MPYQNMKIVRENSSMPAMSMYVCKEGLTVELPNNGHTWDPIVERLSSFGGYRVYNYTKVYLNSAYSQLT